MTIDPALTFCFNDKFRKNIPFLFFEYSLK